MSNILLYLFENYLLFEHTTTQPKTTPQQPRGRSIKQPPSDFSVVLDLVYRWLVFMRDQTQEAICYQATRVLSPVERATLSPEAEQLLHRLTELNLIMPTALERILAVCVSHQDTLVTGTRLAYIILFVMINTEQSTHDLCTMVTRDKSYHQTTHRVIH